jgi:hypothetical protein
MNEILITLGEIAYTAYCEYVGWKSVNGSDLPKWKDQKESLKLAWNAAANAVVESLDHGDLY